MLESQRLAVRLSEVREKVNGFPEDGDTAELERLTTEHRDTEVRYRAAILKESADDTPQDRPADRRELAKRAELRAYLQEAATGQIVDGAAAELRQEVFGSHAQVGRVPWEALLPLEEPEELRQDVATAAPATVTTVQRPILARVFARSATRFLGVEMPSVPTGDSNFPVLTGGVTPTQAAKGATVHSEAATFGVETLDPRRLTARYVFRIEDLSRFNGMEDALRRDLRDALADSMDNLVLNGDGSAPNPTGFFSELTAPADPGASATISFAQLLAAHAAGVDGRYAQNLLDVRMLIGSHTYRVGAAIQTAGGGLAATDYLIARSGGLRVSSHVVAPVSDIQGGLTYAVGGAGSAVAPIWEGLSLVRDIYSGAAEGEIAVTALGLWNFKIVREDPYQYVKFRSP